MFLPKISKNLHTPFAAVTHLAEGLCLVYNNSNNNNTSKAVECMNTLHVVEVPFSKLDLKIAILNELFHKMSDLINTL
jgi:hypothetical protein